MSTEDAMKPEEEQEKVVSYEENQEEAGVLEKQEDIFLLEDLTILSPESRSSSNVTPTRVVHLPPLPVDEPVQSIRLALQELVGYAHFTSFRLEAVEVVETLAQKMEVSDGSAIPIVSPYTTRDNVYVSVSSDRLKKKIDKEKVTILDDYGDLTQIEDMLSKNGPKTKKNVALRIVLEEYNPMRIREHVLRLRQLFSGEQHVMPIARDLITDEEDTEKENGKSIEKEKNAQIADNSTSRKNGKSKKPSKPSTKQSDSEKDDHEAATKTYTAESLPKIDPFVFQKPSISNFTKFLSSITGDNFVKEKNLNSEDNVVEGTETISKKLNDFDKACRLNYTIQFSGYHPPRSERRLLGDLAYLEVFPNNPKASKDDEKIYVTATSSGFFVNNSTRNNFDPRPSDDTSFSHTLLDCLILHSKHIEDAWGNALKLAKERVQYLSKISRLSTPFETLARNSIGGKTSIDSAIFRPSWLVPMGHDNDSYEYDVHRLEADLGGMFGIDLRGGPLRDWNEEIQSAREMSKSTQRERIDRARMLHKALAEFGEAAVVGAIAIIEGQIMPMNPNETVRSHVYLHNNIFFSRALDNEMYDTYRVATGDNAVRKTASRDASTIGAMHRLDCDDIYTLGTVVVDYLGTRLICQSVIPGLLHGENCHKVVYGAVETGTPLVADHDMHILVEETIGKKYCVASRPVPCIPLIAERIAAAKAASTASTAFTSMTSSKKEESKDVSLSGNENSTVTICGPLEVKGIRGADNRKYLLDLTRLTPRDANWVPKASGGTGFLEFDSAKKNNSKSYIPNNLDDPEWTMAVLRSELINTFVSDKYTKWTKSKQEERQTEKAEIMKQADNSDCNATDLLKSFVQKIEKEDEQFITRLRFNVNVFLPDIKTLGDIDGEAFTQQISDEDNARELANFLSSEILPKITSDIRENQTNIPSDGIALTEFIHRKGINCRYLGILASLAAVEEEKDKEKERGGMSFLRKMPLFWLELLECEMVARAAKHVLDSLLTDMSGRVSVQPTAIIAAFLSSLVSTNEESAAETEKRLAKADTEELSLDTQIPMSGEQDRIPDRVEVWEAIRIEVGRRFRYNLSLYNKDFSRALFIPLLRRVCQRCGIRILARDIVVGGKCHTEGLDSFPISARDIIDVVPLVKHAASLSEGFQPYAQGSSCAALSLHIALPDAKAAFDSSQLHGAAGSYQQALQLSQEATELYTKVVDTPIHASVIKCMDFSAAILYQAQEQKLAAAHAARCLALSAQLKGFDSHEVVSAHSTLAHLLLSFDPFGCVKHTLAAVYLMELISGRQNVEIPQKFQILGNIYMEAGDSESALKFYQYIQDYLSISDVTVQAFLNRSIGIVLSKLSRFKEAIKCEQKSQAIFAAFVGKDHEMVKQSNERIAQYTTLAVKQGTENAANKMASQILEAEEEDEQRKKTKKNGKSRKGKSKKK